MALARCGVGLLVLALLGCGAAQRRSPSETLYEAAVSYYDGLRWKQYAQSAVWLPPELRAKFLERREAERETTAVLEYEIRRFDVSPEADAAYIEVRYSWHRLPSTTIRTTRMWQRWKRIGEGWAILEQGEVEADDDDKDDGPSALPF